MVCPTRISLGWRDFSDGIGQHGPVIERADQLILNYVSRAADAAHGVLRQDQRLDFVKRLRARIELERQGLESAKDVARVLARFGDPVALVEREARRLEAPADAPPTTTREFPKVRDVPATSQEVPPGVAQGMREAQQRLARKPGRGMPFAGLRSAAMASANPMTTGGRDAMTIVKEHPRDVAALAILVVAALLTLFDRYLPAVAIFRFPVLVWALGALLVIISDSWALRDRIIGIAAPMFGYVIGGMLVGGLRLGEEEGIAPFFAEFWAVSGVMFMIGAGVGVVWLAYRLFDVS